MKTHAPEQNQFLVPFDQIKNNYNINDNLAVYLSNYLNKFYELFGNDCVISGVELKGLTYDSSSYTLLISQGRLIQDSVLCYFPEEISITDDNNSIDGNGKVIVYTDYSYAFDTNVLRPLGINNTTLDTSTTVYGISISQNQLKIAGNTLVYYSDCEETIDHSISATLKSLSKANTGLAVRCSGTDVNHLSAYMVLWNMTSGQLLYRSIVNGRINDSVILNSANELPQLDKVLRVEVEDILIRVYIDDVLLMETVAYSRYGRPGICSIGDIHDYCYWDDVTIITYAEETETLAPGASGHYYWDGTLWSSLSEDSVTDPDDDAAVTSAIILANIGTNILLTDDTQTDNFNRVNGAIGASWTKSEISSNIFTIVSEQLKATTGASLCVYSDHTFPSNQESSATWISSNNPAVANGPAVRISGTYNNARGYMAFVSTNGYIYLWKFLDQDISFYYTQLSICEYSIQTGDVVTIRALGANIYVLVNDVEKIQVYDESISTGQPGFVSALPVTVNYNIWDNWSGKTSGTSQQLDSLTLSDAGKTFEVTNNTGSVGSVYLKTGQSTVWSRGDNILGDTSSSLLDNWITSTNDINHTLIISNQLQLDRSTSLCYYSGTYNPEDYQESRATWISGSSDGYNGPAVRISGTYTNAYGYVAAVSPTLISLVKFVNEPIELGGSVLDSSAYTIQENDVVTIKVIDDVLEILVNETLVVSYGDTTGTITSGNPGFMSGDGYVGDNDYNVWDNFQFFYRAESFVALTPGQSFECKWNGANWSLNSNTFNETTDPVEDAAVSSSKILSNIGSLVTLTESGPNQKLPLLGLENTGKGFLISNNVSSTDSLVIDLNFLNEVNDNDNFNRSDDTTLGVNWTEFAEVKTDVTLFNIPDSQDGFNPISIKTAYYDEENETVELWDSDTNRVVLGLIDLTVDSGQITDAVLDTSTISIIIDDNEYFIRGQVDYNFDGGWIE